MDNKSLIEWDFIDDDKIIGSYDIFYILIRKTRNAKPFELRIFKKGEIWVFTSFSNLPKAIKCANDLVTRFYKLKETMEKKENNSIINNIIDINEWKYSHGRNK